jgi:hypothetical protein
MTVSPDVWNIASVADAARARAAVDRVATDAGAPTLERARFLTALTARLRHCLGRGGEWELLLHVRQSDAGQTGRLEASLSPVGHCGPGSPAEAPLLTCPLPHQPAPNALSASTSLPEALLRADENTAAVLSLLDEQESLVRLHREELHQTNQGVLALHADLEAAALAQRAADNGSAPVVSRAR